jgi:predicted XRE-type DNA-binding protein
MPSPDLATIEALRRDVALQIARALRRRGATQVATARELAIPQPTLSKIMNGRVSQLSLELLLRVAVRAGVPIVLQTGTVPEEAGAFLSGAIPMRPTEHTRPHSRVAEAARLSLLETARRLTPAQRLAALADHSELVTALHRAAHRPRSRRRTRE